ncbi:MAG: phosphoribosylglycinamide formyltransferase [Lachnospiraceae bacterium]|nr:phosphoribosylglycinamide formyltransferase [Lachnospiraceae bacterium]
MLKVLVCVSGGGTNLQAIIDAVADGKITNAQIVRVISNNRNAYALERAKGAGIDAVCVSPKDYDDREKFNMALLQAINEKEPDLIVLAGFLVVLPEQIIHEYRNRIINIHPSLIPSFCGKGFYGLKVHEEALKKGVKVTGATVHFVDEGTDTGQIILQKAVYVEEGDTPEVLQKRVMEQAEWELLPKAIDMIANNKITSVIN